MNSGEMNRDIHELLPQQEPYVLVDTLQHFEMHRVVTQFTVRADSPFVSDGRLAAPGLLENMAQTSAARIGYINKYILHKDIAAGLLAAVPYMKVQSLPAVGQTITTTLEVTAEVFDMSLAHAEIRLGDEVIATAEVKFKI